MPVAPRITTAPGGSFAMPMSVTALGAAPVNVVGSKRPVFWRHEVELMGVGGSMQTVCGLAGNPARISAAAVDCPECLDVRNHRGTRLRRKPRKTLFDATSTHQPTHQPSNQPTNQPSNQQSA